MTDTSHFDPFDPHAPRTTDPYTVPLTPDRHYGRADELIRGFDPDGITNEAYIPNLLRALTHAVLATASDEVWRRATYPDNLDDS